MIIKLSEAFLFRVDEYISPGCACDIEGMVRGLSHVTDASFDPLTGTLKVTAHKGMVKKEDILRHLEHCRIQCSELTPSMGRGEHEMHEKPAEAHREHEMRAKPMETHELHDHHAMMEAELKRRFIISLVFTIPVLILSPTVQGWFGIQLPNFPGYDYTLLLFASIVAIYGGWFFFRGAVASIRRGVLDMMVLVSIAVGSGYLFSVAAVFILETHDFYWEISTLVVFILFGHWMEMKMTRRASGAIRELVKLIPPTADLLRDGEVVEIPTSEVKVGDVLLVRPGGKVPMDGVIIEGRSAIDEHMITGESTPVTRKERDRVIGGTINGLGAIKIRVDKTGEETAIAQIMKLMQEVMASKPRTQRLADRAAHYLTLIAIFVGLGSFIFWNNIALAGIVFALTIAITVIVIACPHALGLAIPTVTAISISLAASNGILVKNSEALEMGQRVDTIVFDKTGTLTQGAFNVTDVATEGNFDENELLQLGASLESQSEHPIGVALVRGAKEKGLTLTEPKEFEAIAGHGVRGLIEKHLVVAGTSKLMGDEKMAVPPSLAEKASALYGEGKTLSFIAVDGRVEGVMAFADELKPSSVKAIGDLHGMGMQVIMLTGDNRRTAEAIAKKAGVDRYLAEVLPQDKTSEIGKLQKEGRRVAMVGDGINDAPALIQADVGIAIGAGTDVAIESADVILIKSDPADVSKLVRLSKATMRKMKENLFWATAYNSAAIPIAAGILAPLNIFLRPEYAAIIMSVSSIIVVVNALLLRREGL